MNFNEIAFVTFKLSKFPGKLLNGETRLFINLVVLFIVIIIKYRIKFRKKRFDERKLIGTVKDDLIKKLKVKTNDDDDKFIYICIIINNNIIE